MMKKTFCFVALMLISVLAFSQEAATVSGKVTDKKSNPISGASVNILNTNLATATNAQGGFEIRKLAPGYYTIAVSALGYATINESIHVAKGTGVDMVFQLEESANQLGAVVVTAEKKEENVQAAPLAITALSAKDIDDYRLWDTKDLTAVVPNLYSGNSGDGRNVTSIRGITTTAYDPAVATYVDGVNEFTLDTYMPQLFDAQRIEVLRGPQGTLYGRNAMGGVINIITKQPANITDGYAEASVGNYGEERFTAAVRTPLVKDKLYFGAAGFYQYLGGYYTNLYTNSKFDKQHSIAGNYYLKYIINPKWAATLNVKHVANRNWGAFPLAGSAKQAFATPYEVNQNAVAKMVDNVFNTSLSINHAGHGFNFSSQTAYQQNYRYYATPIDGDFSPLDIITEINNYGHKWNNVHTVTQELSFTSPASNTSALKWTAGAYLFSEDIPKKVATHFGNRAALYGSPDSDYAIINVTKQTALGAAGFAQATYSINKQVDVIGGIRYDYQHSKEEVEGQYQPDASPAPIFNTQKDTSGSANYGAFSPMVSLALHPSANTNLYAIYSRGYRTGGLTDLSADPTQPPLYAYKPEYSNNFEVGVKSTFLDNHLRANIALFYSTITDAQVPTLVLPSAITITKNAGDLASKGVDAELAATPVKGLELAYNFGYTHARYTTLNLSSNGVAKDFKGNSQIFTPDVTSMFAAQYSVAVNKQKSVKLVLRGEWQYLGKTYFDLANKISQGSYNLLNAKFGVTTKYVDLLFWDRNITNVTYISYAYDFGAVHLGTPNTYGVTVRGRF